MALHAEPDRVESVRAPSVPARRWPIGAVLIALCGPLLIASFLKSDWTRNDFERFDNLPLLFLFFALCAGLCGAYVAAYFHRHAVSRRSVIVTGGICAALLLASFPVGSKDVFAYAFLGKMWGHYRVNPYIAAPEQFQADSWYAFLSGKPFSVYGPLFLWQTWLVEAVTGRSLWAVVWLHKALATALLLMSLWIARTLLERSSGDRASWLFLLLAWNPLLLFESAGEAHNDIAMVLLLLGALWCWQGRRFTAAFAFLALSVWYKWYSIVFVPAFLIDTLRLSGLRTAVRQALGCAALLIVSGVVLLSPLSGSLPAILGEWLHPQKMRGICPNELSPVLAALFWSFRAIGLFPSDLGGPLFDLSRLALFAAAAVLILTRQWRSAPLFPALLEGSFLIGLAAFMLLITQLWPWHLLTVVVLGILCDREPFVLTAVVLTVLGMLSYFLTFAIAAVALLLVVAALGVLRWSTGRELYPRSMWGKNTA